MINIVQYVIFLLPLILNIENNGFSQEIPLELNRNTLSCSDGYLKLDVSKIQMPGTIRTTSMSIDFGTKEGCENTLVEILHKYPDTLNIPISFRNSIRCEEVTNHCWTDRHGYDHCSKTVTEVLEEVTTLTLEHWIFVNRTQRRTPAALSSHCH